MKLSVIQAGTEADPGMAMGMPIEMVMATVMGLELKMELELAMAMATEMLALVSALTKRHQNGSMWIQILVGCSK